MAGVDLEALLPPRPAWMADAACREHPEVDFFAAGDTERARQVCAGCLVREDCLAYGQANREVGMWGGRLLRAPRPPAPSARRRVADLDALAAQAAGWRRKVEAARAKRAAG